MIKSYLIPQKFSSTTKLEASLGVYSFFFSNNIRTLAFWGEQIIKHATLLDVDLLIVWRIA